MTHQVATNPKPSHATEICNSTGPSPLESHPPLPSPSYKMLPLQSIVGNWRVAWAMPLGNDGKMEVARGHLPSQQYLPQHARAAEGTAPEALEMASPCAERGTACG